MESYSYKDLIKNREDLKAKYNSDLLKLNTKKEKLWTSMEVNRWELNEEEKIERGMLTKDKNYAFKKMCHKETNLLTSQHKRLGYFNKMNMDELRRQIANHSTRYTTNMKAFVENFYPTLTDAINVWSNLATNLNLY